ncbi:MAG: aldehyde dehydrogenase family protein [candidate division Zixibacteria bacterium]|nr:aldehyde dehydrogenase family protein [candidate division Zixibacteria bacterium]
MLATSYPYYLGGRPLAANTNLAVIDKFSGEPVTRVALADGPVIDEAIALAVAAEEPMRKLPAFQRQAILNHCVRRFEERAEELALALCLEAGKPIRDARGEVTRLIDTFRIAAEESVRILGEVLPLDIAPRARGYLGMWKRVPVGACALISPFNFPLNLVAHKIAPAIAAGCPFVLKPASYTPVGALLIGEILSETDLPAGAFSILPARRESADLLVTDERLKLLSFTGSPAAGWDMKARCGHKKVVLELGGNAACVVDADADLDDAAQRIVFGAFYQSGQSCISVQRIIVHETVYATFKTKLAAATKTLKMGDPRDESTFIGPLISEDDARRLENWIQSAVAAGGRLLCGGRRDGVMLEPTLLEDVPPGQTICTHEAFGPVAILSTFRDFGEALSEVNNSKYGLQAGIFTRDIQKAHQAWDTLQVGGVVIGDVPSWRVDHMPYGGVKESGFGREGIRWAIEDMTEIRLMVLRQK